MPKVMPIDLTSSVLWGAMLVLFLEPFFKPLIVFQEKKYQFLSYHLGQSVTFFAYVLTSYLYSIWAFLVFHNALFAQPHSVELQRNEVLMIGYGLVVLAFVIKMYCYHSYGMAHIMGGKHFNIQLQSDPATQEWPDVYYHPVGTATVLFYLGCAIIRANVAGIFLTMLVGLGYYCGSLMERRFVPESSRGITTHSLKASLSNLQSYSIILYLLRKMIPIFKTGKSKRD